MKVINRFQITAPETTITVPEGAEVLKADMQMGILFVWVLLDPKVKKKVTRTFAVFGTDVSVPSHVMTHVGSAQEVDGRVIWHVFQVYAKVKKEKLHAKAKELKSEAKESVQS